MALAARAHTALLQAQHKTAEAVTRAARKHAVEMGWPVEAALNIRAHVHDGRIQVTAHGSEEWEYGTEDRPPLPAARHFENRADAEVNTLFHAHLSRALRGVM